MAYSNFKLKDLRKNFQLEDIERNLFPEITSIKPSEFLIESLSNQKGMPLISEKAKSEVLVVPILMEIVRRNDFNFTIFSGAMLDADISVGLNGECDFLLSKKAHIIDIQAPIFALIEAKDDDIKAGIPQCAAQMLGARIFNSQENVAISTIFGCVTNGDIWQFLKLEDQHLFIDEQRYYLSELPKILGILQEIIDLY